MMEDLGMQQKGYRWCHSGWCNLIIEAVRNSVHDCIYYGLCWGVVDFILALGYKGASCIRLTALRRCWSIHIAVQLT